MKKIILIGRSEAGKTTLTQALRGEAIRYHKTQYVNYDDDVIDTPGEYIQSREFARAIGLYTYEADVVGFLIAANETYCLFDPGSTAFCNRDVIGIITKINDPDANLPMVMNWMDIMGVEPGKIFLVDSVAGEGVEKIREYLERA
ncbi:MAG: ethanolamine utilization protein EutP [Clostridia bacterium]|nr:ethanolamine utilization protein EutP [Clostridia bacterium]